ncbi:hypothetical protein GCM10010129_71040 [Streptomyces fumigatiscleroticus]|nr:hypothetical protein GCM10010129_71040 [Streptomyces fumigatiscleroticus]
MTVAVVSLGRHGSGTGIAERHAATDEQRRRQVHPSVPGPHEAVRIDVADDIVGIAEPPPT